MTKTPQQIANEVHSYLAEAVGDMAADMVNPSSGFFDEIWDRRIKAARRKGVRDIQGWLADELYNDPDTIADLAGDKIYEATNGDKVCYEQVLKALEERAYPGMKKAVAQLRKLNK